ncbi:hypothetical protein Q9323_07760 [Pseudomonas fulva]|uniref:hypothetical protein n=1 Tax=Pseudomonas fulva TaxID=47880 RepID=UPI0031F6BF68
MKTNALDHINFLLQNIDTLAASIQPLWHPLGFVSCVIRDNPGQLTLRVHYWPPNERRTKNPDWPVHTHSYALSSLVLHGNIEDIQCEITDGEEFSIYKVSYLNGDSEISRTDKRTRISKYTSEMRIAGEQYRVERGVFHQSVVKLSESAVTFVALSESSCEAPFVLGGNGDDTYPYDRTPFNQEVFWSAVRYAISNPIIQNLAKKA